jgi:hypothetical protein
VARAIEDYDWGKVGGGQAAKDNYMRGDYVPPSQYKRAGTGSAAAAPAGGGAAPAPFVNEATTDPYLDANAKAIQERQKNFGATAGRAIDLAGSKIRDAAEGSQRAIEAKYSRLGTFGSGEQAQAEIEQAGDTQNRIASSAADISIGREKDLDAFMLQSTTALGAPGAAARGDRALAIQQWAAQESAKRGQEASDLARQMAILQALGAAPSVPAYQNPAPPPPSPVGVFG